MGPTWPRHPEHKRRPYQAFFSDHTAVWAALTFCQRPLAYCLWVWLKKKKKEEGSWKMQLLKLEETECRPHRDNHRLMWHSSITTATRVKPLSRRKVVRGREKRRKTVLCCTGTDSRSSVNCCTPFSNVMACCPQMDFYAASQLYLFNFTSTKLAEAIALFGVSGHQQQFLPNDWFSSQPCTFFFLNEQYRQTQNKACVSYTVAHSLTLRVSECGWYICAWCMS